MINFLHMHFLGIQEPSLLIEYSRQSMTSERRGIHSYNLVEPQLKVLKGLRVHLILKNKEELKKSYGNLLGILNT